MFALFGRVGDGRSSEVEAAAPVPPVWASGGRASVPFITITRRDGREWVLTIDEAVGLIQQMSAAVKAYRREVG